MARNVEFHLGLILVVISYSAAIVGTSGYGYPQKSYQTYDKRVIQGYGHSHGQSHGYGHGGLSHGHYGYGRSAKSASVPAAVPSPRGSVYNGYTKGPSYEKPTGVSYQQKDGYDFYDSYTQPKRAHSGLRGGSYTPRSTTTALATYNPSRVLNFNPSSQFRRPTAKSAYTPGNYSPSQGYTSNSIYKPATTYTRLSNYAPSPGSSYSSGSGSGSASGSGYIPSHSYSSVPSYTPSRSSYSPAASSSYGSGSGSPYTSTIPSTSYSQRSPATSSSTSYSQSPSKNGPLATAQKSFGHGHGQGGYGYDPCSKLPEGDYVLEGQFRSLFPYADPQCNFVKCANYKAYVNPCAIGTKNDGYGKGFCYYHDLHKYCGYPVKQTKRYY